VNFSGSYDDYLHSQGVELVGRTGTWYPASQVTRADGFQLTLTRFSCSNPISRRRCPGVAAGIISSQVPRAIPYIP